MNALYWVLVVFLGCLTVRFQIRGELGEMFQRVKNITPLIWQTMHILKKTNNLTCSNFL